MNPLKKLQDYGQSIWLDYIRRSLITSGELQRLVEEDGLRGITSNPTIFEKAIAGSADYDDDLLAALAKDPSSDEGSLYEALAIEDIQMAADVLRPVYGKTEGGDGFVSLEVSPRLAHDTEGTIAEARRLWQALARPNVMIKVPATPEGIPAIEALLAHGINVNVTLMFSLAHYEAVAHAYIRGVERSPQPQRVASVASFFVSRVDTLVDRELEVVKTPEAQALRGKTAIANSKMVYRRFREIFYGEPFAALRRKRGARVQRPLWASTGTKNPAYSDVLYVEELIGPDTVNTLPPATLDAFREHVGGMIRAVIFDLDGTLVQTEKMKALSYAIAVQKLLDLPEPEPRAIEAYRAVIGSAREAASRYVIEQLNLETTLRPLMEWHGVSQTWEVLTAMRMAIYRKMVADPRTLRENQWPHTVAFLRLVRGHGCKTGLATMSHRREALHVLQALDLEGELDVVLTREDVTQPKPAPEIYLGACRRLEVPPAECLAIEDSVNGARAALAAGIETIAVATPFTRESLYASELVGSMCLVEEPEALVATVERCLRNRHLTLF